MERDKLIGDTRDCFGNEKSEREIEQKQFGCVLCCSVFTVIICLVMIPVFAIIATNFALKGNVPLAWTYVIMSGLAASPFILGALYAIYILIREYLCVIIL
jgi:hypothetical protein